MIQEDPFSKRSLVNYFSSLFPIARQWQVGQYAADTAREALVPGHLTKTAELHLKTFAAETVAEAEGIDIVEQRQTLVDSLREVLSRSQNQHLENVAKQNVCGKCGATKLKS